MVHMHEVAYMLVTELKTKGTENGNDGAHNPLQIPLAVCFGSRPHGIAWPFSKDRCSQNTSRVAKKTLHAAAENVDFVRDLETRSYLCGYTSPRVSSFVAIFFQNFTVTDCGMKFCAALVQIVDTLKPQILLSFLSKIHLALSGCRTRPNAYCCLTSSDILAIVLFFPNSSFISNY